MATRQKYYELLDLIATLSAKVAQLQAREAPGDQALAARLRNNMDRVEDQIHSIRSEDPAPPDGGMARLIGLGPEAATELDEVRIGRDIQQYNETVSSERLKGVANLYFQFQFETAQVFRAVLKLQELFKAGMVRLSSGPGAYALYKYDIRSVLQHSRTERLQAYKRVFGYTDIAPAPGATANTDFHRLFTQFNLRVAKYFRDKRISEVIRPAGRDLTYGSIAEVRRAGLDLRANLKQASYGHVSVLVMELSQLLESALNILEAEDVKQLFGAEDGWEVLADIQKQHLGQASMASQRSRMATAGRSIIQWLAQPHILESNQDEFDVLLSNIGDSAEEWLVTANTLGLKSKNHVERDNSVVPFDRASLIST